ncbi:MaoC family dehydratase N-terminal domain-containing protein [Rhodobacteraceae bacterium 10Alg 79]|uniref:MaoC family dehydratase N-terminal domain-containing protein n=2 Tax=Rhodalgimonas zhirmunskyi TaxID=2964767 RepID=A0AAJ1U6R6_9RHOB|nr:MaoC family dehydratase N-terminal domain-containing protein [Rhodoalgimonas zhirmunskyi]
MLDPARASAMQAALGRGGAIAAGDALPPFYHQLYFWEARPPGDLGRDGHPRPGRGVIPDMGLPRRMWAGGRLEFHGPLRAGEAATKTTQVESTSRKEGRSGPLAFVTLRHEIAQAGRVCVTEMQDLVYREDPGPDAVKPIPPVAPVDEESAREAQFDATLLFRYSALTFNGHRIHYDAPYAREVEGYAGLVTHGPLLAQLLMLMAQEELGSLKRFAFRATSPLTLPDPATLCRKGTRLWVRAPDGRQCMQAEADV